MRSKTSLGARIGDFEKSFVAFDVEFLVADSRAEGFEDTASSRMFEAQKLKTRQEFKFEQKVYQGRIVLTTRPGRRLNPASIESNDVSASLVNGQRSSARIASF